VKYGFSSKVLAELGGGEKQRVLEFAAGFAPPINSRSIDMFHTFVQRFRMERERPLGKLRCS
jgi:hypothetical protein